MPVSSLAELQPRHLALLKPSALGDIVHALPVLTAIRQRFPNTRISWIVNRVYAPLLEGHPDLDAVIPFDRGALRGGLWSGLRRLTGFWAELRQARFDVVLDLQGLLRTGLIAVATGARRRVGLSSAREGSHWFYTDRIAVPAGQTLHAIDRYLLAARAFGASIDRPIFRLPRKPEAEAWAEQTLSDLPRPWLMLGVGSRWLTKRWLPAHFARLATQVQQRFGGSIVFVGAKDEADLATAVQKELTGPTRNLSGLTTLPQLSALLGRTDLMLANDTGPLHLAVALGRPVVAPYTCTRVALTGPYHPHGGGAVETRVACAGSLLKCCPHMRCMAELTPDRLWPLVAEVLHPWKSQARSA